MQAEVALRLRRSERWGARPRRALRCTRPRRAGTTRPCARCELGSNVNGKWLLTPEYTRLMQKNREQQRVCHVLLVFELIFSPPVCPESWSKDELSPAHSQIVCLSGQKSDLVAELARWCYSGYVLSLWFRSRLFFAPVFSSVAAAILIVSRLYVFFCRWTLRWLVV